MSWIMDNIEKFNTIATLAVANYNFKLQEIKFLAEETNILYKLTDDKGNPFILKIYQEDSCSLENILMEVYMMELVSQKGEVSVPFIMTAKDGSKIQEIKIDEDSEPKQVVVYSWLEGKELDGNENEERFVQLGELTAKLHNATYGATVPKTFSPKRWDSVFYYHQENVVYKDSKYQHFLTKEYHDIMDKIIPYLNHQLSSYYQKNEENLQLIHSDLNPWNILVHEKAMHVIDFGDILLGLPQHDIAILLYYYRYEEEFNYKEVQQLFFKGYERVRPLPMFEEFDLELLMTARRVNFLNYILTVSEDPSNFIEKSLLRVKEFINTYNPKI